MKIGILTYHYALNYGAFLQAMALQEYLIVKGHHVEFVNYENDYVNLAYKLFRFNIYNKRRPLECFKRFLGDLVQSLRFAKFRNCILKNLNVSSYVQTKEYYDLSIYDCIIIGSDQLWNPKITKGLDFFYAANFNKEHCQRVVGYAISMNKPSLDAKEEENLKNILNNFDCLSLRESTSVELLQPLTEKEVNLVIDPTFLLSKEEWMTYVQPINEKDYICCYPVLNQKQVKARAKQIAKTLKKKLVILEPVAEGIIFSDGKKINTPFEFLSYIANADLVLTSSFHGTAFSLIMKKNFYILGDDKSNVRMKNFLRDLGIQDRIIPMEQNVNMDNYINYTDVDKKLNIMINNSKRYLDDAINS